MNSLVELKKYSTKILFVVAIIVVLYGIFYFIDQFSSYLYPREVIPFIWLLFRLFLAVAIICIGLMLFKMGRAVSKTSLDSSRMISFPRKKSSVILFLMIFSVSVPFFISFYTSSPSGNYGYFPHYGGRLMTKDRFVGYYGQEKGNWRSTVRIANNVSLQTLFSRSQAKGYDSIYNLATIKLSSSEERYMIYRSYDRYLRTDYLDVWVNRGGNETSFDYAVPEWIKIDVQETSEDWLETKLRDLFPSCSDQEYSEFAGRLASGHGPIQISGSPSWTSIQNHLGALDYVHCVPMSYVFEYYSNGKISYKVPSIVIRHKIPLFADESVTFVVAANGYGFVDINVNSEYLLYERWVREVFSTIFFDVDLPVDAIWEFELLENYLISFDL